MEEKRLTIADIAKATGYSVTTVSRALSGKGRVPEKTRQYIKDYVKSVNYHPNIIAISLSASKTYNVGIVFPCVEGLTKIEFFYKCLYGMTNVFQETDYSSLLVTDNDDGSISPGIKGIVANHKVDSVILMRAYDDDKRIAFLKSHNIPFVLIGRSNQNICQVDYNHRKLSYDAIINAISKIKVSNVLYLSGSLGYTVNMDRYEGYQIAVKDAKMKNEQFNAEEIINIKTESALIMAINKIQGGGYDLVICADEEIYVSLQFMGNLNSLFLILECSKKKWSENNVWGGGYCDTTQLGQIAAKLAINDLNFDDNSKIVLDGEFFVNE